MNLQYISDSNGQTTGVFIPISEWNKLMEKFKAIAEDILQEDFPVIPQWHKDMVQERITSYKQNPKQAIDFDTALDDIETHL